MRGLLVRRRTGRLSGPRAAAARGWRNGPPGGTLRWERPAKRARRSITPVSAPLNLQAWIEENRALLQPPVGNVCLHNSQFLVMVVGGPNARTDYHVNPGEELFFQVQGDIVLRVIDDGRERDVPIRQGELFLLPAGVP